MQARYDWQGGVAYGCCERKLQRRLNWLLAILLLNDKMFIFLLLLTFDLSGGQKKGNRSSSSSQRRLRSVLGFTDDPEDMAVVAVVARPVSLMWVNNRCQDSSAPTPCPPGQNKTCSGWRVWKVLFWPKKIPSEMEGMGDLAKWLQCYKGAVQEMITMYSESGGLN